MIRSQFISSLAVAAMMAAPALANAASSTASRDSSLPPCSSLEAGNSGHAHPQAGKLADKSTGQAKEHSASPVHQDCKDTSKSDTSSSNAANGSGMTSSSPSSASTAGSTPTTSSDTGSTANSSNSMTGSTSNVSPNIDLRGRSSVNIDNTTSTGDQSQSSSAGAASGSQTSTDTTKQPSGSH